MGEKKLCDEEKTNYIKNIHGFQNVLQLHLKRPWLRLDWIFKLSEPGRRNKQFCQGIREFGEMLIKDRQKNMVYMDRLIKESDNNGNFTHDEMIDEVSAMMAAGHETSTLTFTWFLYMMARNPEKQVE
uniref:Cytochrome P450 n=1 Tax=Daphnia galeata TaxID=27404 RepID=A0A8J2RGZ0_9CRUS|nr:unnamed protein product [Daphnia galeata]